MGKKENCSTINIISTPKIQSHSFQSVILKQLILEINRKACFKCNVLVVTVICHFSYTIKENFRFCHANCLYEQEFDPSTKTGSLEEPPQFSGQYKVHRKMQLRLSYGNLPKWFYSWPIQFATVPEPLQFKASLPFFRQVY